MATDFRLYVRDRIDALDGALAALQLALARKAEAHAATVMPGFTHLQPAQPVTFGHHLLAYVEMLGRDRGRLADARARLNECPLGSAALAGTSFPIDRHATAEALGFDRPTANSLDAVVRPRLRPRDAGRRASICAMHLSRFAEEIVIWMTPQFGFIKLSDKFTTGSSIMPQKRNPDAAELARAKVGRIAGAFQSLLIVMKGLPLAYSKDMQEDKEVTFDALDSLRSGDRRHDRHGRRPASRNAQRMLAAAGGGLFHRHRPRRLAGARAGHAVPRGPPRHRADRGGGGEPRSDLWISCRWRPCRRSSRGITADVFSVLSVENSVKSRTSYGGTAPQNVRKMARAWIKRLEKAAAG